jgi:hypothetical protein
MRTLSPRRSKILPRRILRGSPAWCLSTGGLNFAALETPVGNVGVVQAQRAPAAAAGPLPLPTEIRYSDPAAPPTVDSKRKRPTASRIAYAHLATVSSTTSPPATTTRSGRCMLTASPIPLIPRGERLSTFTPARTQKSSSARMWASSRSSSSRDASPRRTESGRTGGGRQSRGSAQPICGPPDAECPSCGLGPLMNDLVDARKQDLLDRALDRP